VDYLVVFPFLNIYFCSDRNDRRKAGTTGKLEQTQNRNDWKAGMTGKNRNDQDDSWTNTLAQQNTLTE
jgi:hypothetical protein